MTHVIPDSSCSACGHGFDRSTGGFNAPRNPNPGDISICINCGEIAKFGKDLRVMPCTPAEKREIYAGPSGNAIRRVQIEIAGRGPISTAH